ncbi:MAG: ATP synthase F1 subunit epsilon [Verrucomicrobia bacterium]|nr:ATP synthase F1 subunit epsilon [Verrucomicrobiota bacterium]
MAGKLRLVVVTPEGKTFDDDVEQVVMPGVEGQLGILPGHVPLLTQIQPGELDLQVGSRWNELAVGGGFVEVAGDRVTILTDMAVKVEDIDEHAVERALENAKKALLEKAGSPESAELMAMIQRSTSQLNLKRKRRTNS